MLHLPISLFCSVANSKCKMSDEEIFDPVICVEAREIGFDNLVLNYSLYVENLFSCLTVVLTIPCFILPSL